MAVETFELIYKKVYEMANYTSTSIEALSCLADLTIDSSEFTVENGELRCQITICNNGGYKSYPTRVKVGESTIIELPSLAVGEKYEINCLLPIPAGNGGGTVAVTLDPFNEILEANKLNNRVLLPYELSDNPYLKITNLEFFADDHAKDISTKTSEITVSATVKNLSAVDSGSGSLSFFIVDINKVNLKDKNFIIDSIAAGEERVFTFTFNGCLPIGEKVIQAKLFGNNESIENAYIYTTVASGDDSVPALKVENIQANVLGVRYADTKSDTQITFTITNQSIFDSVSFEGEIRLRRLWEFEGQIPFNDDFYLKGYKSIKVDIPEIEAGKTRVFSVDLGELSSYGGYEAEFHFAETGNKIVPQDDGTIAPVCQFDVYSEAFFMPATLDAPLLIVDNSTMSLLLRWSFEPGDNRYIYQQSANNNSGNLQVEVAGGALCCYNLEDSYLKWQVRESSSAPGAVDRILPNTYSTGPQSITAIEDQVSDLLFVTANDVWEGGYYAQHQGNGIWNGTGEIVRLAGKVRIEDCFFASKDKNVLFLTDEINGDALFVEDFFTQAPVEVRKRIANLDEIRAGYGEDIIDLSSKNYHYQGDGLTIRGGAGNDTIWAYSGTNYLFGDEGDDNIVGGNCDDFISGGVGNDCLHGGGGNDVFCFGENWGKDVVTQLPDGKVTLWFLAGDKANWNNDTLTYHDGDNQVRVEGVSSENITLFFGNEAGFDDLFERGLFADSTTEKIYDDSSYTTGVLAVV